MTRQVLCGNCQGSKHEIVWDSKKKTYLRRTCSGCKGKGYWIIGTE